MIELAILYLAQITESVTVTGVLITTQTAMTGAIVTLYRRSIKQEAETKKCLEDRAKTAMRLAEIESRIK